MKFFYDTEFLEGTQTKRILGIPVGKTNPTIDLISIGIVAEGGREYYAISNEFNLWEAWNRFQIEINAPEDWHVSITRNVYWLRENVLKPIYVELATKDLIESGQSFVPDGTIAGIDYHKEATKVGVEWAWDIIPEKNRFKELKRLIKKYGKPRKRIAEEVMEFSEPQVSKYSGAQQPIFYGYYSAYDHVALCWLFGKMIDLPKGFPMYTIDLKQILDEKQKVWMSLTPQEMIEQIKTTGDITRAFSTEVDLKQHPDYPKNPGEHNSLSDARWNKKLHDFLIKFNSNT